MRFIALLAVTTALFTGPWCAGAQAMPLAVRSLPGAAAQSFERVANICGIGGCGPVWTKRVHKPPPSFVKLAAPIVVAPQPRNTAPIK